MKERFYATVSHELRSPLTAMRESVRLIEGGTAGQVTPKQERLLTLIHKSTERLLRLVDEILDLSRASANLMPLERRWIALDRLVAQTLEPLRPQAEQRGISLRMESGATPPKVLGDEDRIVQVVTNLVANALRFTPPGGSVTVRLGETDRDVQIQVEDTGSGIPAKLLPVIFERFRQAHPGRGGTGLGLAIVRALVEAHGGDVTVQSEEGKGTQFTVSLPRGSEASTGDQEVEGQP